MIRTKIDEIIRLLKDRKRLTLDELAKQLLMDIKSVEKIAQILDKANIITLSYPINVVAKPWLELKETKKEKQIPEEGATGKIIDEYAISGLKGHATGNVKIILSEIDKRPMYFIETPQVSDATRIYFDAIKDEISKTTPMEQAEIVKEDIQRDFEARHRVIANLIEQDIQPEKRNMDILCGILLREMYGLGEIEILIADDQLEEIVINSSHQPVAVYHRRQGWLKTNIRLKDEEEVENYSSQIARKIGKQISLLNPILDAHLVSGDRVNSTLFPISTGGNTVTLRLFARNPWTIVSFLDKKNNVLSTEMAALLWQAVHYEMNIIVSGGTASGKCVSGDTEVIINDKIEKIKDVVENALAVSSTTVNGFETTPITNLRVLSFNPQTMKIEKKDISRVWKKKTDKKIFIKTQTGKEIFVTPEHPFFTFDYELTKINADELKNNSFIAVPRIIPAGESEINLELEKLKGFQLYYEQQCVIVNKNRSTPVSIPYKLDKKLARIIGFLIGDGHITKQRESILFFNTDYELLDLFKRDFEETFGIKGRIKTQKNRVPCVVFHSAILKEFFIKVIGIPAGKKSYEVKIQKEFFQAKKEILCELVKSIFESEAGIIIKKGEMEFGSASKQLVKDVNFILSKFGIISRMTFKIGKNRLFIAGKHLDEFNNKIGMISTAKKTAVIHARKKTFSPNFDFVPGTGKIIKYLKEHLCFYQKEVKGKFSRERISRYICDTRKPTRESLKNLAIEIEKKYHELNELKKEVENLEDQFNTKIRLLNMIKNTRFSLGINRKKLAQQSGINVTSLLHWEQGNFIPSAEKILCVGRAILDDIETIQTDEQQDKILKNQKQEIQKNIYELERHFDIVIQKAKRILKIGNRIADRGRILEEIKCRLNSACSDEVKNCINNLRLLADSDVIWDKIIEIKKIETDEFVYDLTVEDNHTFIANNMLVHNTSALNAVVSLVQPFQRVISIEDTRELSLPSYQWNWVPLVTRAPNPEGLGEITMLDLVVNALRMRPDRIIMGEIRRKLEAEVLFEAMHTGHSVYATMHADTGTQTIKRLIEPPIEIPASEVEDVHLIMVQYRDRRKNIRRTLEISEVSIGPSGPELNHIYAWKPRVDEFQLVRQPRRYIEQMNLHTGMTEREIFEDQNEKKKILNWMLENRLTQIEDVGIIMKIYYSDLQTLLNAVEKNISPSKII